MRTLLAFALLLAAGCYESATPMGDAGVHSIVRVDLGAPPVDAGDFKCPFGDGLAYDPSTPYPFCQWDTAASGWERYCPPTFGGWGYSNWHTGADATERSCDGTSPDCNTCLCALECSTGPLPPLPGPDLGPPPGPCPTAPTGTAVATCVHGDPASSLGACMLFCDHAETCPDGMHCVLDAVGDTGGHHHFCAWAIGTDRCSI